MHKPDAHPRAGERPTVSDPTYQDRDIDLRAIVVSLSVILVIVVLSGFAMALLFNQYERHLYAPMDARSNFSGPRELPPAPLLQVYEARDLSAFRAQEDDVLNTYAWVDRSNGVVRIPLTAALEMVAHNGLPVFAPAPAAGGATNSP